MKKEIADKWVKALRSGKYKQATGLLEKGNAYCCLGVLCSISKKKGWTCEATLPENVMKWSGVRDDSGSFGNSGEPCLASLNDSGKSFTEIADIIEKRWEQL